MADIFISYAREDRDTVGRLAAQLEAAGLSCWWDRQLGAGDKYLERTETELNAAKAVLVVWSKHSAGSHWVADEAGVGRDTGRLAPISLDGTTPPLGFRQFQVVDFSPWLKGDMSPLAELKDSLARFTGTATVKPAPGPGPKPSPWRGMLAPMAAALVLLVIAASGWVAWNQFMRKPALEPSIAVLPFENISGDPAKDYLARGVAMEIIDTLAGLEGMKVISRNSSFTFSPSADPVEVGARFKVAHVLSGTVRDQNGRLTVTADLVNARTGAAIRSDTYVAETVATRIEGMPAHIAGRIAAAMSIAFDVDTRGRLHGGGTDSLEAYDLYLRGLDAWWNGNAMQKSVDFYAQATDIDPDYAEAWAGMAISLASAFDAIGPADAHARQVRALELARRAVGLAPNVGIVQTGFAAVAAVNRHWIEADEAFHKALAISRNEMALTHRWYMLQRTGRLSESASVMKEIEEVDPVRGINYTVWHGFAAQGRNQEVEAHFARLNWFASDDLVALTNVVQYHVNFGGSRADIRKALEGMSRLTEQAPSDFARRMLANLDNPDKARADLEAAYADPRLAHRARWDLTPYLAAWLGDTDFVLRVWRDELPQNVLRALFIWDPVFAEARSRPEFKALVRDLGLVDYWRASGWADKCRPLAGDDFECF